VITIGQGLGPQFADPPREIVGVVGTVKEAGVANGDLGVMYLPEAQVPQGMMNWFANSFRWPGRCGGVAIRWLSAPPSSAKFRPSTPP